jgi:hypothetical protein
MATPNNDYFMKMDGFFLFMLVAVLVLIYQVFMVDRYEITKLKKVHRLEGYENQAPYDFGRITRYVQSSAATPPGASGFDLTNTSGFLGGGGSEPPISFYPSEAGPLLFGKDYAGYPPKPKPAAMAEGMWSPVQGMKEGAWSGADQRDPFYNGM